MVIGHNVNLVLSFSTSVPPPPRHVMLMFYWGWIVRFIMFYYTWVLNRVVMAENNDFKF